MGASLRSKPSGAARLSVLHIIIHENYSQVPDGPTGPNNLALLRMVEPLQLSPEVAWPICLPSEKTLPSKATRSGNENGDIDCDFSLG